MITFHPQDPASIQVPNQSTMVTLSSSSKLKKEQFEALASRFKKDKNSRYSRILSSAEIQDYISKNRKRGLYNCNHCKASYHSIYELALHFDLYNISRSFYCNHRGCPYTVLGFASSNECHRHLNSVHGEKSHVCGECGQAFSRIDQLNAHVARTHKNPHSRFNKKLYKQKSMNFIAPTLSNSSSSNSSGLTPTSLPQPLLSSASSSLENVSSANTFGTSQYSPSNPLYNYPIHEAQPYEQLSAQTGQYQSIPQIQPTLLTTEYSNQAYQQPHVLQSQPITQQFQQYQQPQQMLQSPQNGDQQQALHSSKSYSGLNRTHSMTSADLTRSNPRLSHKTSKLKINYLIN